MEKRTRVQRYAELREKMMETDVASQEGITIKKEHLEEIEPQSYQPLREKVATPSFKIDEFHNEYLDDFIKEVKAYNIRKGNAVSENTQINILQELRNVDVRQPYMEEIEDNADEVNYFDDISKQVAALIQDVENESLIEEIVQKQAQSIEEEVIEENEEVKEEIVEQPIVESESPKNTDTEELLEETRKIQVKMDAYQENVDNISSSVKRTNMILNIIISILIVLILIVIGLAVVYMLWLR